MLQVKCSLHITEQFFAFFRISDLICGLLLLFGVIEALPPDVLFAVPVLLLHVFRFFMRVFADGCSGAEPEIPSPIVAAISKTSEMPGLGWRLDVST